MEHGSKLHRLMMTIRLKVRIILFVCVTITVYYIVSHVYRLNHSFDEAKKTFVFQDDSQKHETVVDSPNHHIQLNATKDTLQSSADHTKIKTFKSLNHDIFTQYKFNHQVGPSGNYSAKFRDIQAKKRVEYPKHVELTAKGGTHDGRKISVIERETETNKPLSDEIDVFLGMTIPPPKTSASRNITENYDLTGTSTADDRRDNDFESAENDVGIIENEDKNVALENNNVDDSINHESLVKNTDSGNPPTSITSSLYFNAATIPFDDINSPTNITDDVKISETELTKISDELVILPASLASENNKIYFDGGESSTNKTDKVKSSEPMLPILPTIPEKLCDEDEGIDEKRSSRRSNCNLYSNYLNTCTEAAKYYDKDILANPMSCSDKKHPPICRFLNSSRIDDVSRFNLKCNYNSCHKNEVHVGILNSTSGTINYMFLNDLRTIVKTLKRETKYDSKERGADFVFLNCNSNNNIKETIHQILIFPPLIKRTKIQERDKLHVNIVVLDSLSRNHFYRTLKQSTAAMKSINMDTRNPNMVLDFKAFQSLAPFTYVNLQALLSGTVDYDSISNRRYNFEQLFTVFRKSGYQTLLQEDTCWYDEWGSILTGNRKLETHNPNIIKKIWNEIQNLTLNHVIDIFGLTHMSCEVLAKYSVMNLFNSNAMVCLNGDPLSSYFLNHVLEDIIARDSIPKSKPLLSYTHINMAHESSGLRIMGLDKYLKHFISTLSKTSNTLSIFLSDHGGKTNDYFMNTLAGRYEVYDPFLFMILPKTLRNIVGEKNFQSLIDNQNSLMDVIDLRSLLLSLNKIIKRNNNNNKNKNKNKRNKNNKNNVDDDDDDEEEDDGFVPSLITESIKYRSDCQHLSIRNYALCKCFQNVTFPNVDDIQYKEFIIWLAEFAMGYLNNKLANQQKVSNEGHKCTRIIANNNGSSIVNVVERRTHRGTVYLFDVVTQHSAEDKDIFNFQLRFNDKRNDKLELLQVEHWMRISIYSRYATCKDKDVSHEICICSDDQLEKINKKYLASYKQFHIPTESVTISNSTCLFLLKRVNSHVVTFELANTCEKKVNIEFATKIMYSWVASKSLPLEVTIQSGKIMFLVTFMKVVDFEEDIQPNVIIKK